MKLAKDNIDALPVVSVIHTNNTKKIINEPNNENNWPVQKNK